MGFRAPKGGAALPPADRGFVGGIIGSHRFSVLDRSSVDGRDCAGGMANTKGIGTRTYGRRAISPVIGCRWWWYGDGAAHYRQFCGAVFFEL